MKMVVNPTLCWSLIGEGNAIRKYLLDADAHYIAVDEIGQKIFAAVKNTEGGWSIASYVL